MTLENLKKVGITDDSMKLMDKSIVIMDPAYVHISEETESRLDTIKDSLRNQHIYTTGRYGKWTYCSMEDCMVWAKEIATQL